MQRGAESPGAAVVCPSLPRAEPRWLHGPINKFVIPEIVYGVGTMAEVGGAVRRLGGSRALVVSDAGVLAVGWVDRMRPVLDDAGLEYRVWHGVTPNPKDYEVTEGLQVFLADGCDVLLALGGGSCIDAAKAIAVLSTNGGSILDYEGINRIGRPIPPIVCVPTTGGSGADVSQFCIVTDTARRLKAALVSRSLVPDISITDPLLLTTMPLELSASTAMDALTHAIEASVSEAASFLSDVHAHTAIRLVLEHLDPSLDDPDDIAARAGMAKASLQAGLAFTNSILGAAHAISHQIGGLTDLPHGIINAVLLPHVMRYNAVTAADRYRGVASALGIDVARMPDDEAAAAAIEQVERIGRRIGIPRGLRQLGVRREDFGVLAENAMRDACITTNPRPVSVDDARAICEAAY